MQSPIGHIITWRVPTRVPLDSLRAAMAEAGIPEALAGDLHPRHALARALREMAHGQPRIVRRLPTDDQDRPRMQLTREYLTKLGLDYQRECVLTLDGGVVRGDDAAIVTEAQRLLREHIETRMTHDLTRLVQRVVSEAGTDLIPVREAGGAYFVPAGAGVVAQLAVLLERIGGKLCLFAVTLGHGTEESIANTLADYLIGQIGEFRESIKGLGEDTRADVRTRRLERIAGLKQRLSSYRTLLGAIADRVAGVLREAEGDLLAKIGESAGSSVGRA
jgi:hypothetical protein